MQDVVPESDDGLIVARGKIGGKDSVILAIEGQFQVAASVKFQAPRLLRRLIWRWKMQEEASPFKSFYFWKARCSSSGSKSWFGSHCRNQLIAHRPAATPTGRGGHRRMVGCFGGMSITASLCTYLIMTRQARLAPNGPEVIEEQSGIEESIRKTGSSSGCDRRRTTLCYRYSHQLESSEMRKLWSKGKQL